MIILQATGQFYHEFHADAWIQQPWNTFSSLVFFVPVIYWLWQLRGQYRQYPVLVGILPLLFLNGLGSTLFHANSGGVVFVMLDVLPPLLMLITLTAYLWKLNLNSWLYGMLIVVLFLGVNALNMYWHSRIENVSRGVNVFYFINGLMVLTPMILSLQRHSWKGWNHIALALIFISLALVFRSLDYPTPNPFPTLMPQGTHFLWHISSALAVFPLGRYLILLQNIQHKKTGSC
ncbi:MAG: hypothetical protein JJ975_08560 [Bacteroidia bacterium]|nr:hypothetical protein [Bacteroidia bacterium]